MTEFLKGFTRGDVFGARFGTINVDLVSQFQFEPNNSRQLSTFSLCFSKLASTLLIWDAKSPFTHQDISHQDIRLNILCCKEA